MLSIITTLNYELHTLSTWLKANKLSLNNNKTYYIIFPRARINIPDTDYPIILPYLTLKNQKHRCVILDSKNFWIHNVKNKVAKWIGIMFKARTYLDSRSLINLYNACIYRYLIYCVEPWDLSAILTNCIFWKKRIDRLFTFSNYNVPSEYIFRELQVLPLYIIL